MSSPGRVRTRSQGLGEEEHIELPQTPSRQRGRPQFQGQTHTRETSVQPFTIMEEQEHVSTAPIFNPAGKEDSELDEYIDEKMQAYEHLIDYDLWQAFSEDFKYWSIDHFLKVPASKLIIFRKLLHINRVYSDFKKKPTEALNNTLRINSGEE